MGQRRQRLARAKARALFMMVGTAVTLSTIVVGMDRTSYLTSAIGLGAESDSAVAAASAAALRAAAADASSGAALASAGLDLNVEHVQIDRWVQRLTTSLKGDFEQSLTRMDRYSGMITAKLDARQMPRELIYLAMIESNFNPTARSPVSAVGLWQFMRPTGRQFGLAIGKRVDERKNPAKATDAALTYLSQLHDRFGSWYLAAAAYNSGQGTVSRALKSVTGKTQGTDEDFFRILSKLPKETQDYVPKLIASARVGSDPARYGLAR